MKIRIPPPSDLYTLPSFAPLLFLDFAAAVAANALRTQHVAIEGDFFPDECDQVTTARALARQCDLLRHTLNAFRRDVMARRVRESGAWPF